MKFATKVITLFTTH